MSYYTDKEIDEHLDPLKNNFNSKYFASLPDKFKKVAKEYTIDELRGGKWTSVMVKNILNILEITSLTDKLTDQGVINDEGDNQAAAALDKDSLWEIFDASDEPPDDVRAFVELHTLMTGERKLGAGGAAPHDELPVEIDELILLPKMVPARGGKRSRRRRTRRHKTGAKKSRKQRKRTTIKGSKRKRRRTRG